MATPPKPPEQKRAKHVPAPQDRQPDPVNRPLATVESLGKLAAPLQQVFMSAKGPMPRAAIVYAAGSSMVFVAMLFSLFSGSWVTALILLVISGVLMAHSVFMIRNHSKSK